MAINDKLAKLAANADLSGLTFNLTPSQFISLLQQQDAMKLAIDRGFLDLLTRVGLDYKDASSPYFGQYARAYQAIATLFPASLGYTDNSAGGLGVVPVLKHTGDLRMARSLAQVGGVATGLPTIQGPPIAALTSASNVAGSVQQVATPAQSGNNDQPSIIMVEFLRFGGGNGEETPANERKDTKRESNLNYDPRNALRILGNGAITSEEVGPLTAQERKLLSDDARSRM
ncbi:hypothetical protein OZ411_27285 [Bradyrhizobium sp. Arg237L]|uniref:hypothetical protein n=1 Tax=Bradyrhizobium sp. Arg237L TaxID=3003352 RepID=UPI00249E16E6|nr:hypothetical protein [Bradyrhizobium sp. Arg237L]MDI4236523.1 hypothetical protein [Bradyrhizobium sp. Arg237L]